MAPNTIGCSRPKQQERINQVRHLNTWDRCAHPPACCLSSQICQSGCGSLTGTQLVPSGSWNLLFLLSRALLLAVLIRTREPALIWQPFQAVGTLSRFIFIPSSREISTPPPQLRISDSKGNCSCLFTAPPWYHFNYHFSLTLTGTSVFESICLWQHVSGNVS